MEGSWCADFDDHWQFLQVHFKSAKYMTGLASEGNAGIESWVTKYKFLYNIFDNGWQIYQVYNKVKVKAMNKL